MAGNAVELVNKAGEGERPRARETLERKRLRGNKSDIRQCMLTEEGEFLVQQHGGTKMIQEVEIHELPQRLVVVKVPNNERVKFYCKQEWLEGEWLLTFQQGKRQMQNPAERKIETV